MARVFEPYRDMLLDPTMRPLQKKNPREDSRDFLVT